MLPFLIPLGTTLEALLLRVLPTEHAARVSPAESPTPIVGVVTLAGAPSLSFTLIARGPKLEVREGEATTRDTWIWLDGEIAELFVREWAAGAPRPMANVPMPTDPRLLRRVQMVNGRIELVLRDFAPLDAGGLRGRKVRASMTVAAGAAARKPIESGNADCVIETNQTTFDELLGGTLGPDDALADDRVDLRGKRMIAMQFAFAFAPFFPPKR